MDRFRRLLHEEWRRDEGETGYRWMMHPCLSEEVGHWARKRLFTIFFTERRSWEVGHWVRTLGISSDDCT